jgi:hypothetical protein
MTEPYFGGALPRRYNRDGSRNIFCRRCHRLVGTNISQTYFGSVSACAICLAAEEGTELSDEALQAMHSVRIAGDGMLVPSFVLQEDKRSEEAAKTDPLSNNPEDRLSMRHWFRAATIGGLAKTVKELITKSSGAQQLAKDKKLKRVFSRSIEESIEDQN